MLDTVIPFPAPVLAAPSQRRRAAARGLKAGWNPWPGVRGGRVFLSKTGAASYYVDRKVGGVRYSMVNLQAHDPESAIQKLRRWEASPATFNPHGDAGAAPVHLTPELVTSYVAWCAAVPDGKVRRRNTDPAWIAKKRNMLGWWAEQLVGRNLRSDGSPGCVTTDDLVVALKGQSGYRHRLEAIKAFYGYLRSEAGGEVRVQRHHDPSDAIPIPRPDAAQVRPGGSKVAWTKEDCDKVIGWLERQVPQRRRATGRELFDVDQAAAYLELTPATVRAFAERGRLRHEGGGHGVPLVFRRAALDAYDRKRTARANVACRVALALRILGGTGWHVREVVRFSKNGQVEQLPPDHVRQNGAAAVLTCWHKGGFAHPTAVTKRVAEAAAELVRLGGVSYDPVFKWTARAVKGTGSASFSPGRFRHQTGTFQMNRGVERGAVSKGLGHKSEATTAIYVARAVAPKLPTWY